MTQSTNERKELMEKEQPTLVWHYLRKWARETPDREALVYGDLRVSFGDYHDRTRRVARLLLELGLERGDRVAMLSPARDEYMYVYLATGMVGGIWFGLNPRYTLSEFRYAIGDARPRVAVVLREYLGRDYADDFKTLLDEFPFLEKVLVIGEPWGGRTLDFRQEAAKDRPEMDDALAKRLAEVDPDDGALIVYTSGTTGRPKGALLSHRNIVRNIEVEVNRLFLDEESTALVHFPINHVACSTEISVGALIGGSRLVFLDKFDPRETLETVQREKVTMLGQIPAMFLLELGLPDYDGYDLGSVRYYVWAGAAAPESMVGRLATTGAALITGYGLTETTGFVTYTGPGDSIDDLVGTAGAVDPAFDLKLVDKERREVPCGEVGEIALRGECVMKGYWERPEATAEVLDEEGWLYTGDLATMDERGAITIVGRTKEMFKSGGYNVYPREIEAVIEKHPNVAMVTVIPVPHEIFQEVGKAIVMPKPGAEVTAEVLEALCREHLANYKVPKSFEIRPMLPMLPSGKIDRMALIEEEKAGRS